VQRVGNDLGADPEVPAAARPVGERGHVGHLVGVDLGCGLEDLGGDARPASGRVGLALPGGRLGRLDVRWGVNDRGGAQVERLAPADLDVDALVAPFQEGGELVDGEVAMLGG
jgi:hypothetical protein